MPALCGGFMWSTGEDLRDTADAALAARLKQSGPLNVDGLQGNETWRVRRAPEPPLAAYFIDYDDIFTDEAARGHMGDIAIARACLLLPPPQIRIYPTTPGGPPGRPGRPRPPGAARPDRRRSGRAISAATAVRSTPAPAVRRPAAAGRSSTVNVHRRRRRR